MCRIAVALAAALLLVGAAAAAYAPAQRVGEITAPELPEVSGLAASALVPGRLWVANDGGHGPQLHALDARGGLLGSVELAGAENRDWEDLAAGPGSTLYVGDMGDNDRVRDDLAVYRVREPREPHGTVTAQRFPFRYPDGRHDAEALLVDPRDGRPYVVTKQLGDPTRVYRFPLPLRAGRLVTLQPVRAPALARIALVTGGSWAPDGGRLAVRTYLAAYELPGLGGRAKRISLPLERQGEAIAYTRDSRALLTTSEKLPAPIHRLARR